MKLPLKAVLFSTLVFPGAGYFLVNKPKRGIVVILVILGALGTVMLEALHKAEIIAQKIVGGEMPYDVSVILQQIDMTEGRFSPDFIAGLSLIIGAIWLLGIIDAYRLGKAMETKGEAL